MRAVDADALKDSLKELKAKGYNQKYVQGLQDAIDGYFPQIIDDMPTVDVEPVKQDTELSIILQDYSIKDTDTLRYILDQYQKIIVDITSGQMSYLTYPAEAVIACADDNYRKCHEESMKHGEWIFHGRRDENGRNIYRCSECNFEVEVFPYNLISWRTHEKYCPGCGARMDGDNNG